MGMKQRDFRLHLMCEVDEDFQQQIADFCEGLVNINVMELELYGSSLPCCLPCGGVRYVPPPGCPTGDACQQVYDALMLYQIEEGTCLDIACEYAARLRTEGEEGASVLITHQLDSYDRPIKGKFHAAVERANGQVDDPAEWMRVHPGQCIGGH